MYPGNCPCLRKLLLWKISCLLVLLNCSVQAQSPKIKALKDSLNAAKNIGRTLHALNELAYAYYHTSSDTVRYYARQHWRLSKKHHSALGMANAKNHFATAYFFEGVHDSALVYYEDALQRYTALKKDLGVSVIYNNMANIHKREGNYPLALDLLQKGLAIQERLKNLALMSVSYNNMGNIYSRQGEYAKALRYIEKALEIRKKLKQPRKIALSYSNLGVIYKKLKKYRKSLNYHQRALLLSETIKRKKPVYYINTGEGFLKLKMLDSARFYNRQGVALARKLKNKPREAQALNISARISFALANYPQAIDTAHRALSIARKVRVMESVEKLTKLLSLSYQKTKNYQKALEFYILYTQTKDSLFNKGKTKEMTSLELNYAFDKKKAILKMENEKKLAQERWYLYTALGVLLTVIIVSVFVFRSRQVQKSLNTQLELQKAELTEVNADLQQANDEITTQRDHIEEQNIVLTERQYSTESSIKAARNIQQAMLPSEAQLKQAVNDYFIIYRPKKIVSGDFYWIKKIGTQTLLVVADCVGHGIPGAFMSLIGISLLDKIVFQEKITAPAKVFDQLHREIDALLHDYIDRQWSMGLDAMMLSLTPQDNNCTQLVFAGARTPLYYVQPGASEVSVIKGDRKSIGGVLSAHRVFTNQTLTLPANTLLYAGSDGLQDQNNVNRQSFGSNRLKQLLDTCLKLSLPKQKQRIENCLDTYMKDTTQRDDILWIGVRL